MTSRADDRGRRDAGFALYELILALAIISLVAAVVFPRVVRAPGAADLRANAQEIAALLRTDRNAALRIAAFYEGRLDRALSRLTSVLGPAIMILVSMLIAWLIVSVISALLSVNELLL